MDCCRENYCPFRPVVKNSICVQYSPFAMKFDLNHFQHDSARVSNLIKVDSAGYCIDSKNALVDVGCSLMEN